TCCCLSAATRETIRSRGRAEIASSLLTVSSIGTPVIRPTLDWIPATVHPTIKGRALSSDRKIDGSGKVFLFFGTCYRAASLMPDRFRDACNTKKAAAGLKGTSAAFAISEVLSPTAWPNVTATGRERS